MKKSAMTDVEIRLACIEAAAKHFPCQSNDVVAIANDYYRFITGKTDALVSASVEQISKHRRLRA